MTPCGFGERPAMCMRPLRGGKTQQFTDRACDRRDRACRLLQVLPCELRCGVDYQDRRVVTPPRTVVGDEFDDTMIVDESGVLEGQRQCVEPEHEGDDGVVRHGVGDRSQPLRL